MKRLFALLLIPLVLAGCGVTKKTTPEPLSGVIEVSINNATYTPASLTVTKGSTIRWINNDTVDHVIVSDSGAWEKSTTLKRGEKFEATVTTVGVVKYHCGIHPAMKGEITVVEVPS